MFGKLGGVSQGQPEACKSLRHNCKHLNDDVILRDEVVISMLDTKAISIVCVKAILLPGRSRPPRTWGVGAAFPAAPVGPVPLPWEAVVCVLPKTAGGWNAIREIRPIISIVSNHFAVSWAV